MATWGFLGGCGSLRSEPGAASCSAVLAGTRGKHDWAAVRGLLVSAATGTEPDEADEISASADDSNGRGELATARHLCHSQWTSARVAEVFLLCETGARSRRCWSQQ